MKTYTDKELETMLDAGESELVEWKPVWKRDEKRSGRKAVCAFANDYGEHEKPGVLFVGINDDGTPSGLEITDELILKLTDIKLDGRILPPPCLTVEKRRLRGADVAVVTVQPSQAPPTRYDGRIYIRVGSCCGVASVQDEKILCEKRLEHDVPPDIRTVARVSIDDLSKKHFEDYLSRAIAPEVLEEIDRTYGQNLSVCNMVNSSDMLIPTVLGVLAIGHNPMNWIGGAYVQFLRFQGTALYDTIVDEQRFNAPLLDMFAQADMKIDAHNRLHIDTTERLTKETFDYPSRAIKEIVRNGVMHRSYDGPNSAVLIYWFDDRIEIISPGGPFGIVNCRNFGKPGLVDWRNLYLADAMRVLRLANKFGTGIQIAQMEMERNGNPPIEFDVQPESVRCILRKVNTERDA